MSAFLAAVGQAAVHGLGGGFVLALARGGPRELELDRPVRRR